MGEASTEIEDFLSRFSCLKLINDGKKVKCSLSGHEMPSKVGALQAYVTGKKFLRLHRQHEYDYAQHEPHLVLSTDRKHRNQLYCNLTQRYVNKIPGHVERHVMGKRYKRELKRYEECKAKGVEYEPRRKPQKGKKKANKGGGGGETSRLITDMEQLGMDFLPSDSEEESDRSSAEMLSGDDTKETQNHAEAASGSNNHVVKSKKSHQLQENRKPGFKKAKPKFHSSKSRQRKFGASLHGTRGIKQPNKVTKSKKL